ncbi:MAG: hypothetical protein K5765_07155 [Clostridia bacterium]|nr:hypothetical protein [Clostridia bacterium]
MKRIKNRLAICVFLSIIILCLFLSSCKNDPISSKYFNNFVTGEITGVKDGISLSSGTLIYSYDEENDLFITFKNYTNNTSAYGIAGFDKEYVVPQYSKILEINGDYAIVVDLNNKMGVIKFKGKNVEDNPIRVSSFEDVYVGTYDQMCFKGDYIVVNGEVGGNMSSIAQYKTIYDFSQTDRLLELYKIEQDYNYSIVIGDSYVCSYDDDDAYFYDLDNTIIVNGYLKPKPGHRYNAWNSETDYTEKMSVFYIGNGWFVLNPYIYTNTTTSTFDYNFTRYIDDTFEYVRSKCSFFNVKTGESKVIGQISYIDGVVNKYNKEYSKLSSQFNNYKSYNSKLYRSEYDYPFIDPYKVISNNQTLIYYYFKPYLTTETQDELKMYAEATFCYLDDNLNVSLVSETLMPIIYQDGKGIITADPSFSLEAYAGNYIYDLNLSKVSYKDGESKYVLTYANKYGCVVRLIEEKEETDENEDEEELQSTDYTYGYINWNLETKIPFEYMELTPMYEGYILATKLFNGKYRTYLFNSNFEVVKEVEDIDIITEGAYVFKNTNSENVTKFGIKKYGGDIILDAEFDGMSVYLSTKTNRLLKCYVTTLVGNITTIKELTYR